MPLIHAPSFGAFGLLPSAGFTCDSVDFDGTNDYLLRGAGLTGAADSRTGIFSCWVRLDGGDAANMVLLRGAADGANFSRDNANKFLISLTNPASTAQLNFVTVTSYTTSATWRHVLASWDTNNPSISHLYISDVSDKSVSTDGTPFDTEYTVADWGIGATTAGAQIFNGCLAELYFAPGQFLDFSSAANRAKFISGGKPVNLGADGSTPTGAQPIAYHRVAKGAAATTFATNLGSGGNFTITGTLDIGSSSPSD